MPKREDYEILAKAIPQYSSGEPLFIGHTVSWAVFLPAEDREFVQELMDKIKEVLREELNVNNRRQESNLSQRSNSQ